MMKKLKRPLAGHMRYNDIDELAYYYAFLATMLSQEEHDKLKSKWESLGGVKHMFWWKFIGTYCDVKLSDELNEL